MDLNHILNFYLVKLQNSDYKFPLSFCRIELKYECNIFALSKSEIKILIFDILFRGDNFLYLIFFNLSNLSLIYLSL